MPGEVEARSLRRCPTTWWSCPTATSPRCSSTSTPRCSSTSRPASTSTRCRRAARSPTSSATAGPRCPLATWTPGEIGVQHMVGPRVTRFLAERGCPVPEEWYVADESPKRGLVVKTYDGAAGADAPLARRGVPRACARSRCTSRGRRWCARADRRSRCGIADDRCVAEAYPLGGRDKGAGDARLETSGRWDGADRAGQRQQGVPHRRRAGRGGRRRRRGHRPRRIAAAEGAEVRGARELLQPRCALPHRGHAVAARRAGHGLRPHHPPGRADPAPRGASGAGHAARWCCPTSTAPTPTPAARCSHRSRASRSTSARAGAGSSPSAASRRAATPR